MSFSEKLDFLMNISKTTNRSLAIYTSLDASYISRLRRGTRKPAKNENYLKAMARFFARRCNEDYQRTALSTALNSRSPIPDDNEELAELIYQWFLEDRGEETKSIEGFLDDFSHFAFKKTPWMEVDADGSLEPGIRADSSVFYGVEGKREAVIAFLLEVLQQDTPQTLLLFSDEDFGWVSESPEFAVRWAALLSQVIMRGNKLKIIHTISRDFDEMMAGVSKWLPIYMTGSIEPYYYPKTRDGIFKRTLFIAPDTVAVISTSIGNKTSNKANFLYKDGKVIEALTDEYNDYLSLCRPLMRIFSNDMQGYLKILSEFEKEEAASIVTTESLSIMTMPAYLAEEITFNLETDAKNNLMRYHKILSQNFEESLLKNKFHEIIKIPDLKTIRNGAVRVAFSEMLEDTYLLYSQEQFRVHLEHIIRLLKTVENYNVHIANNEGIEAYKLYVKEDLGVLVARTSLPSVILAINESNMTAAFWDYLSNKIFRVGNSKVNRKQTIARLEDIIAELS